MTISLPFVPVPKIILDHPLMTPEALFIFIRLYDVLKSKNTCIFSNDKISQLCGHMSRRQIDNALKLLINIGVIEKIGLRQNRKFKLGTFLSQVLHSKMSNESKKEPDKKEDTRIAVHHENKNCAVLELNTGIVVNHAWFTAIYAWCTAIHIIRNTIKKPTKTDPVVVADSLTSSTPKTQLIKDDLHGSQRSMNEAQHSMHSAQRSMCSSNFYDNEITHAYNEYIKHRPLRGINSLSEMLAYAAWSIKQAEAHEINKRQRVNGIIKNLNNDKLIIDEKFLSTLHYERNKNNIALQCEYQEYVSKTKSSVFLGLIVSDAPEAKILSLEDWNQRRYAK